MVDVHARRKMCTLVAAAFVDGHFDEKERDVISRKGREMGLPDQMIDEIIELGRKGALAISVPPTRKQKEDLLDDLIDIACADGKLAPAENHLLMKFARQLGITVQDLGGRVHRRITSRRPAYRPAEKAVIEEGVVVIEEKAPPPPRVPTRPAPEPRREPPKPGRQEQPSEEIAEAENVQPPRPPGPVQLDPPRLGRLPSQNDLGLVTEQLLKQVLLISPKDSAMDEAVRYLEVSCHIEDRSEAEKIIRDLLRRERLDVGRLHKELDRSHAKV